MLEVGFVAFFAFAVSIQVVRIMRRMRSAGTQAPTDIDFPDHTGKRTPTNRFHDETWLPLCQRIAEAVQLRAGRELTHAERRRIWETRAPLILETALKEIETGNDASITALIASLPSGLRRPDPTNWSGSLFIP
jgi:hypothetical protein